MSCRYIKATQTLESNMNNSNTSLSQNSENNMNNSNTSLSQNTENNMNNSFASLSQNSEKNIRNRSSVPSQTLELAPKGEFYTARLEWDITPPAMWSQDIATSAENPKEGGYELFVISERAPKEKFYTEPLEWEITPPAMWSQDMATSAEDPNEECNQELLKYERDPNEEGNQELLKDESNMSCRYIKASQTLESNMGNSYTSLSQNSEERSNSTRTTQLSDSNMSCRYINESQTLESNMNRVYTIVPQNPERRSSSTWTTQSSDRNRRRVKYACLATLLLVIPSLVIALITLWPRTVKPAEPKPAEPIPAISKNMLDVAESMLTKLDVKKNPCDDFQLYSCGGYIKTHPHLKSLKYSKQINVKAEMQHNTDKQVIRLLEESTNISTIEPVKMVKKLYRSCTDKENIEKTMKRSLFNLSQTLGGVPMITGYEYSNESITVLRKFLEVTGELPWLKYNILDDPKKNRKIIRLQLKVTYNKDFVWDTLTTMHVMFSGYFRRHKIFNFCEQISEIADSSGLLNNEDFFDGKEYSETEIIKQLPGFDLVSLFKYVAGISPESVNQFVFIIEDISILRRFIHLVLETDTSDFMNIAFLELYKYFYGITPSIGHVFWDSLNSNRTTNIIPDSKLSILQEKINCLDVARLVGDVLGWMYSEKYFDKQAQEEAKVIEKYLKNAMRKVLSEIEWLNTESRKLAFVKLEKLRIYIETAKTDNVKEELIKIYRNIILTDNVFTNTISFMKRRSDLRTLAMLNHSNVVTNIDVEAVYNTVTNSIHIPIALLQPPLFYKGVPMAVNFGGLGTLIGHEMLHSFDVDDSSYYFNGKWLTNEDLDKYNELKQAIVKIYSKYKYEVGNMTYTVNGERTAKENIADMGGLMIAYEAYLLWKADHPDGDMTLQQLLKMTDLQLFFIAYGQSWCSNESEDVKKYILEHDIHAPMEARLQVPLQNSKDFAEAFGCQTHSNMNPKLKSEMWKT